MSPVKMAWFLVLAPALILAACAPAQPAPIQPASTQPTLVQPMSPQSAPTQPTSDPQALPNPASVFCEEQGGRVETRGDASGGQAGACIFQDGSECDEWAFYREECQPGQPHPTDSAAPNPAYVNDAYGFSFDPPADWSMEEKQVSSDGVVGDYLVFRRPGYQLFVGYQWADEAPKPFRTGMPEGDFIDGGSATLLGQPVPKQILVWDGRNKVVIYNGRIKVGDLALVMYLDAVGTPEVSNDQLNIPPEVIVESDQIIASFALTSGETPQIEFNP